MRRLLLLAPKVRAAAPSACAAMFLGAWGCSLASLSVAAETSRDALERDAAAARLLALAACPRHPLFRPCFSSSRSCTRAGPCSMVPAHGEGGVACAAAGSLGCEASCGWRLHGAPTDHARAALTSSARRVAVPGEHFWVTSDSSAVVAEPRGSQCWCQGAAAGASV